MKLAIITISIVLGIGGLFFAVSSEESPDQYVAAVSQETSMNSIAAGIARGGRLLDVRTAAEYSDGYIGGAELFPLAELEAGKIPEVEKDKPVYVYCRSGNRSAQAADLLRQSGFTNVIDLGGINDVIAIGGIQVK